MNISSTWGSLHVLSFSFVPTSPYSVLLQEFAKISAMFELKDAHKDEFWVHSATMFDVTEVRDTNRVKHPV